jgi:hypothetical protein
LSDARWYCHAYSGECCGGCLPACDGRGVVNAQNAAFIAVVSENIENIE